MINISEVVLKTIRILLPALMSIGWLPVNFILFLLKGSGFELNPDRNNVYSFLFYYAVLGGMVYLCMIVFKFIKYAFSIVALLLLVKGSGPGKGEASREVILSFSDLGYTATDVKEKDLATKLYFEDATKIYRHVRYYVVTNKNPFDGVMRITRLLLGLLTTIHLEHLSIFIATFFAIIIETLMFFVGVAVYLVDVISNDEPPLIDNVLQYMYSFRVSEFNKVEDAEREI